MAPDDLIAAISQWAERDERISAAGLVGSHARGEARPDSDVDLVLICREPQALLEDLDWLQSFGKTKASGIEDYGLVRSVRVFYEAGLEVEFGITGLEWVTPPIDEGTAHVMQDGVKILYDPKLRLRRALKEVGG